MAIIDSFFADNASSGIDNIKNGIKYLFHKGHNILAFKICLVKVIDTFGDNIFGLQRFPGDTHVFGYNFKRLKAIVQWAGFTHITEAQPQDYHKDLEPCMRLEAKK